MTSLRALLSTAVCAAYLISSQAFAHGGHDHGDDYDGPYKVLNLSSQLHFMNTGKGGNLLLLEGEDGVLLVDDEYAETSQKTKEAVDFVSDNKPIKFVINTHWHLDHTGGNQVLAESGSIIVAHDNTRKRLAEGGTIEAFNKTLPPAEKAALPVVTFDDSMTLHVNDETIELMHLSDAAHTDGDVVVFFKKHKVVHMGDLFFSGMYPFIDGSSGGSLQGVIADVTKVIDKIDERTRIVPGHGPLSYPKDLVEYRDMLQDLSLIHI